MEGNDLSKRCSHERWLALLEKEWRIWMKLMRNKGMHVNVLNYLLLYDNIFEMIWRIIAIHR